MTGQGRDEVAIRIERNEPKEQSAAVVNAARRAVVAIDAAVAAAKAAEIAARLATSGSSIGEPENVRQKPPKTEPAPELPRAELSKDALAELDALSRDQVADLLSSFSLDSDPGLVAASQKAHAAWQKAAKVVVVTGRGTREAKATDARSAFKAAVSRVNRDVGATNRFRAAGAAAVSNAPGDGSDMRIADLPPGL